MPKIYKNKSGHITIIYGPNEEPAGVTLVHDRGRGKLKNIFGGKIERFAYHWANVFGNTAYTTTTPNNLLDEDDVRYILKRSKQK